MQEVHLDKHVKLLDSPGIVMDSGNSDSAVILRNCVKVHHKYITVLHACVTEKIPCIFLIGQHQRKSLHFMKSSLVFQWYILYNKLWEFYKENGDSFGYLVTRSMVE